jgi:hypothetical protein
VEGRDLVAGTSRTHRHDSQPGNKQGNANARNLLNRHLVFVELNWKHQELANTKYGKVVVALGFHSRWADVTVDKL